MRHRVWTLLACAFLVVASPTTAGAQGTESVTYIYDAPGRLVAVIDPAGEAAAYTYDAVGNLLSIARIGSQDVSVLGVTPHQASIGASATLHGTGFSSDPGENTVTFNGIAADISSAGPNHLVVVVPEGAETGPVAVTTPNGSASSAAEFVISGDMGPVIGVKIVPGSLGSVSMDAPDGARVTTKSVGSFTTLIEPQNLPLTGTYTLLVDPLGNSTGTTKLTLYDVPPDVTGTIEPGGDPVTVSITAPGQNAFLSFDGAAEQRISLRVSGGPASAVTIRNPDGTTLASVSFGGVFAAFLDTTVLPETGTYTIFIDPTGVNTGNLTLTLYDVPPDVTGTIEPGGSAVTVTITTPGQDAYLTFSGTTDQRVSLRIGAGLACAVSIRKPDGATIASATAGGAIAAFLDTTVLPETGTYTLFVNATGASTGSTTLTLYDVPPDVTGSLDVDGPAVPVTITTPGQNGSLTFEGAAQQQVTVQIANNTIGSVTVRLLKPDGTTMTSRTSSVGSFKLNTQTLPENGTYTVTINPSGANTGSMNVQVTNP